MKVLLLLAFGGPRSLDEVEPFLTRLFKGRPPSPDQLERVKERYRKIGGYSPLFEITLKQSRRLEQTLSEKGFEFRSYIGMCYGEPLIGKVLREIREDGYEEIFALPMTPFRSKFSTGIYQEEMTKENERMGHPFKIYFMEGWHRHPLFLDSWAEKIKEGLELFPSERRKKVHLIFTTHSLPESVIQNDPYVKDFRECVEGLLGRMEPLSWHLAFQSKGGGSEKWVGPDLESVLMELNKIYVKEILIVPIGFVSEHIEILYDIDLFYQEKANALGMLLKRAPSLNDSEMFIEALASIVEEHLKGFDGSKDRER